MPRGGSCVCRAARAATCRRAAPAPAPTQSAAEGGTSRVQARQGVELKGRSRGSVGKADGPSRSMPWQWHSDMGREKRDVLIGVVVRSGQEQRSRTTDFLVDLK
ncbi:hypothetical protein ABZP36_018255 [Zizania latifolia]